MVVYIWESKHLLAIFRIGLTRRQAISRRILNWPVSMHRFHHLRRMSRHNVYGVQNECAFFSFGGGNIKLLSHLSISIWILNYIRWMNCRRPKAYFYVQSRGLCVSITGHFVPDSFGIERQVFFNLLISLLNIPTHLTIRLISCLDHFPYFRNDLWNCSHLSSHISYFVINMALGWRYCMHPFSFTLHFFENCDWLLNRLLIQKFTFLFRYKVCQKVPGYFWNLHIESTIKNQLFAGIIFTHLIK